MKRSLMLVVVLFLIASSAGYSQVADTTDISKEITAKEKEVFETVKAGDMETFERYLADDFMSITSSGIADRAQEVENLSGLKLDSYEMSDVKVIEPADGVAMIIYTLNASGYYQNERFSGKYYTTSTWVESDGEWKNIMYTETEAAPTEGPTGMEGQE